MNISKITSNPKHKKILWGVFITLVIIIPYFLGQLFSGSRSKNTLTVPIIPPTPAITKQDLPPLDTTNPHNPAQKLNFIWGSVTADLPPTIADYNVNPLINPTTITTIANKFGFTALESSPYIDEGNFLWISDHASLFGSPEQNQILFNTSVVLSGHTGIISKEESVTLTKSVLLGLLGEAVLNTFDANPEVKHLLFTPDTEDEPLDSTPEKSNLISVNFQQLINKLPIVSLSPKGETINVAMDTSKKIYRLNIYGGYQSLSKKRDIIVPSFSKLIEVAPTSAMRISHAQDIPSESSFTDANVINITVKSVGLGYFQRTEQDIFPVFVVYGNMTARGVNSFPATYIVPITIE